MALVALWGGVGHTPHLGCGSPGPSRLARAGLKPRPGSTETAPLTAPGLGSLSTEGGARAPAWRHLQTCGPRRGIGAQPGWEGGQQPCQTACTRQLQVVHREAPCVGAEQAVAETTWRSRPGPQGGIALPQQREGGASTTQAGPQPAELAGPGAVHVCA